MSTDVPPASRSAVAAPVGLAVLGLLVAVIWAPTFAWMVDRWGEDGGYYLHGFLVPPAAVWLAWRKRREARWGSGGGVAGGLALVAAGGLLQVPAVLLEIHVVSAVAFLLVLVGVVLGVGGRSALRAWWPALALLVFMVPLPLAAVARANLELKLFAAGIAVQAAQATGEIVVRDGATIALESGETLVVGTVCSGLRFLVSLTALGAFVALVSSLPPRRKAVLFLVSVPVALAGNVVRILALIVIAGNWGTEATHGTVHDVSGGLLFVGSLFALFGLESLLARRSREPQP